MKKPKDIQVYTTHLQPLVTAIREVRGHRAVKSFESPEMQDAWDRLHIAVLEAERILQKPVDKRRR